MHLSYVTTHVSDNVFTALDETQPYDRRLDALIPARRACRFHELVHRYFSPRPGPMHKLRAELRMAGYSRSAFLRYLEEALAEGYGQLRVHGLERAMGAFRFPLSGGYVTISELTQEGQAIRAITLGSALVRVSLSHGPIPRDP